MSFKVSGWDPYFRPEPAASPADTVLLTYVLNVIEDLEERAATLQAAWALTRRVLCVSTRLTWERSKVQGMSFRDGVLTTRSTFQHLFTPKELREYVEATLGVKCVASTPGSVYVFREDSDRLRFLARRFLPQVEWSSPEETSALNSVVRYLETRGRMPRFEEMPEPVIGLLPRVSEKELSRLARASADPQRVEAGARRSTLDTLLFLALDLFNGRSAYGQLPYQVRVDVRTFFRSYTEACKRADRLLLKLRDTTYVRSAMNSSTVGKVTPTALYVHRRAINELPTVLRLYEHCGSIAAGRPSQWNLLKLNHQGRSVSWLDYPEFDRDPHPKLLSSYHVDLTTLKSSHTSYAQSTNRPLLHRKHEFLSRSDPDRAKYVRLTEAELRAGLYERPHLIGTEQGWEAELQRCGRALRGHRLIRRRADDSPCGEDGATEIQQTVES